MASDDVLHAQRRVAGAHRMVLQCKWCPKQRHDSITHHLVDHALVAVNGFHHPLEHGIEQPPRVFRVPVGKQLERTLDISE